MQLAGVGLFDQTFLAIASREIPKFSLNPAKAVTHVYRLPNKLRRGKKH